MNPMKTEAVKAFLTASTHPDLAAMYSADMEVQINVAKEDGERVELGDFKGRGYNAYTNGRLTWKPIRIPLNAKTEPSYTDTPLNFPLGVYAEAIGMTGWDWANRCSRWVAFDFDAIVGHSDKHSKKLDDKQLAEIQEVLSSVPFVTLRRSTSGRGLHLYIALDPVVETANHTEHAALARAILSMLSGVTGFDFGSKVDICGGNMWVWHRKMYSRWDSNDETARVKNNGLELIKAGVALEHVPANWRDHMEVVKHKARKSLPSFVYELEANDPDKLFEELTGQRTKVNLDKDHKKLVDWLAANGCCWWWDQDSHMLVTHTIHLKDAHKALGLKGSFDTNATGVEKGFDHNTFMFPLRNGSWVARRYSLGTKEHESWEADKTGWTHCFYNKEPDLHTLARLHGGIEHEKGFYCFPDAQGASKTMLGLGVNIELPAALNSRKAIIKPSPQDGRLVVHIDAEGNDNGREMAGWYNEKKLWKRVFKGPSGSNTETELTENYENFTRHIITSSGQDAGWVLTRDSGWTEEPLIHVKAAIAALGKNAKDTVTIVGNSVLKAWTLVNKPFQPEYPGNREWNRNAAQLACAPSLDLDNLKYPTWTKIMQHCGAGLDSSIQAHPWCKENNINTGAEFLTLWVASLLKQPDRPSTYLAFYGNQDCGKSIFHEAITEFLITCGSMRADQALQNQQNFNAELQHAILCIVEETDLQKNRTAYNRIKDWVTSPEIMIHPKHGTPYMMANYTHWVQTANEQSACPIFDGDTRITLIYVGDLQNPIPKLELRAMLKKEAPDFLAALLAMEMPESDTRLAVPTINSPEKDRAMQKNQSMLELFISDKVKDCNGHSITCEDFLNAFIIWLDNSPETAKWNKQKIGRELPDRFPRGRVGSDQTQRYGNMTLDMEAVPKEFKYVNMGTAQLKAVSTVKPVPQPQPEKVSQ